MQCACTHVFAEHNCPVGKATALHPPFFMFVHMLCNWRLLCSLELLICTGVLCTCTFARVQTRPTCQVCQMVLELCAQDAHPNQGSCRQQADDTLSACPHCELITVPIHMQLVEIISPAYHAAMHGIHALHQQQPTHLNMYDRILQPSAASHCSFLLKMVRPNSSRQAVVRALLSLCSHIDLRVFTDASTTTMHYECMRALLAPHASATHQDTAVATTSVLMVLPWGSRYAYMTVAECRGALMRSPCIITAPFTPAVEQHASPSVQSVTTASAGYLHTR